MLMFLLLNKVTDSCLKIMSVIAVSASALKYTKEKQNNMVFSS